MIPPASMLFSNTHYNSLINSLKCRISMTNGDETAMKMDKSVESPMAPDRLRPGLSPEADENQLISLSIEAAKKMLLEGKAPTSIVLHYLKLATSRERLEREMLEKEMELKDAKIQALESQAKAEQLFVEAMNAMKRYSGYGDGDDNAPPG